ncbi:type II toxin-antitoxin system VapC family toxin [Thioalkalivibrio paradoxus]|uniref:Ribonuclease VapC n=1 Tax=Thioalkalivibrio paradoxus ARh 1 TaxID=713585 RepID=W0DJ73_9GAMM|nr:type II toxin-antitoxin system VapC family toxin [Thioalkalivibrio paradoxus]AHE97277.1 transcriptional regulator [Thioalkalivibrio paradoxus ARh 1]
MTDTPLFLLDTNILSDLVRHPQGIVKRGIERVGEHAVCTSIIAAAGLRFGAAKRGSVALTEQVEKVLGAMRVEPLDLPSDREYGRLRLQLEQTGQPIGPNDLLIAAHALALGATVVTDNQREFQRVPGLRVENWLQTNRPAEK